MSNFDTIKRIFGSLGLLLLVAQAATAQSTLNFSRAIYDTANNTGIAITNPTSYYAEVQFTLFGLDGNPVANMVNPVNYRIAPKSQIQMLTSNIFVASGKVDGWIQATSSTTGLFGFSFTGDFNSTEYGAEAVTPLLAQVIPVIREDQASGSHTDLLVENPGSTSANVIVTLYNQSGAEVTTTTQSIPPFGVYNAALSFPLSGYPAASARVTSSVAVTATAVVNTQGAIMLVNGQAPDQAAATRIAPHFVSGNGADSQLVLANPNSNAVAVTVTLFSQTGGKVHPAASGPLPVTIQAHGLVALDTTSLTGLLSTPPVNGWVEIDSPNVALNGIVVMNSGTSMTAVPLQASAATQMIFSQLSDSGNLFSRLDLVNPSASDASVSISLLKIDGTLVVQQGLSLPAHSKLSSTIPDLAPAAAGLNGGFVSLQASSGIYGVEILGGTSPGFMTTAGPQSINVNFVPHPDLNLPVIARIVPDTAITANTTLRLDITNSGGDMQVLLGNLTLTPHFPSPDTSVVDVDVPAIEAGFANLRVRVSGLESEPTVLQILPPNNQALMGISGQAFYQRYEVNDSGLDLTRPSMVPIRNARVEVLDANTQALVSVTETGDIGQFTAAVPPQSGVVIRVLSRLRDTALNVEDNSNGNQVYSTLVSFDPREAASVLSVEATRAAGAFNILEMVQRGNDLARIADPTFIPPTPTVFWSVNNTLGTVSANGLIGIGITHFSLATNTAYILGDRTTDSDEFDDSVIIHEYAHMLAAAFSRDDSPGGAHGIGDMEDPRLAWSEGWANFFSGAARNDSVYRDSMVGPNGQPTVLRIDLEDNVPPGDTPGYWSEGSVGSILWDMFDDHADAGDSVQYPITWIWSAIADLKNNRFVYLPYFLENFLARYPSESDTLRTMVQLRSIDFQPNVRPSVTNPFPRPISTGDVISGDQVDSLTSKRTNLAMSSHFYSFATTGAMVTIRMDITGLGDGNNPNFNDLDLFLMDLNGHMINLSDSGLNGQSELILQHLTAGTYVIEVRSYYTKAETNSVVYNSGQYRLTLVGQ